MLCSGHSARIAPVHAPVLQEYSMVPLADNPSLLAVTRAFVVQLRADMAIEQGHLVGRVEHVVSGQPTDLQSLEMLLACIARVRGAEHEHYAAP